MAVSQYFTNHSFSGEQRLLDDLVAESIRIHGVDMWYVPRNLNDYDRIYGSDEVSSFDRAILLEFYIKNVDGFSGQGNFMSRFGLEIRDQVTLSVARRTFEEEVSAVESTIQRPREGDLIYFPYNQRMFEIKFVDHKPFFFQLGSLQMYDITCELYEYSNERFSTGIAEIDAIQNQESQDVLDYALLLEDGFALAFEDGDIMVTEGSSLEEIDPMADNDTIQEKSDEVLDFDESNPFSVDGRF